MTGRGIELSPQTYAQIGGALYLIIYLTNSFALLLASTLVNIAVLVPAFIAELSLALWLLARGVNVQKWQPD